MNAVEHDLYTDALDPIDIVETLAERRDWDFDRVADDQIAMAVEGVWRTYSISLNWSARDETLRLICSGDLAPEAERVPELALLLNGVNDLLWTGAFTYWAEQSMLVYRYGLTLAGEAGATAGQVDAMLRDAVGASERFHPAFQLCAFGGESAERALSIAIAEAVGRA